MTTNSLAFIALCNEYCAAVENCRETTGRDFVKEMLRLLPRIYISASDIPTDETAFGYIDPSLDEADYDNIRQKIAATMGKDDTYLEVFEEDMKYSDTPIGASVSENLADLFQVFYNFLESVREAPEQVVEQAVASIKDDFVDYWSQILCNVLRPLNNVYYNYTELDD